MRCGCAVLLATALALSAGSVCAQTFPSRQADGRIYFGKNPPPNCIDASNIEETKPPKSVYDPSGVEPGSIEAGEIRATNVCNKALGDKVSGPPGRIDHLGGWNFRVVYPLGVECLATYTGGDTWKMTLTFPPAERLLPSGPHDSAPLEGQKK